MQTPRSWLKKTVELGRLSVSLSSAQSPDAANAPQPGPLVTLAGAHVSLHGLVKVMCLACRHAKSVCVQSWGLLQQQGQS